MGEKEEVNRRPVRVLMLRGGSVIDGDENEHREYKHSRGVWYEKMKGSRGWKKKAGDAELKERNHLSKRSN